MGPKQGTAIYAGKLSLAKGPNNFGAFLWELYTSLPQDPVFRNFTVFSRKLNSNTFPP
jgi:hypothetical protein